MSDLDRKVILVRMTAIQKYFVRLKKFESITLEEYLSDFDTQLITERLIQLMTEAALDINRYILKNIGVLENQQTWENKQYFLELANQGIITVELAERLAQAAGMRNILVHQYLEIEPSIVFNAIQDSLTDFPLYLRQVTSYLDSLENNE